MSQRDSQGPIDALASLADPTRRSLYEYVQRQDEAVGRDQAASAVEISRSLAAYHLDRLVESGLLRARFARPMGRSGPGAGRPAKLYERSPHAMEVSIPRRNYQLAARVFAEVLAPGMGEEDGQAALRSASRQLGRAMIEGVGAPGSEGLIDSLEAMGYQPCVEGNTVILRNCLFADLTKYQRDLTCSMNLGLIKGALEARGDDPHRARLDPLDGRCCVTIVTDVTERPTTGLGR